MSERSDMDAELKQYSLIARKARLEKVRNRVIFLWSGMLTLITVTWSSAALLQNKQLAQLGMVLVIPLMAGLILHGVYSDRISTVEKRL